MRTLPGLLSLRVRWQAPSLPLQPAQQWPTAPVRLSLDPKSSRTSWERSHGFQGDDRSVRIVAQHALSQRPGGVPTAPIAPATLPGAVLTARPTTSQTPGSAAAQSPAPQHPPMTSSADPNTTAGTAAPALNFRVAATATVCAAPAANPAGNGQSAVPPGASPVNLPHGHHGGFGPPYDQVISSDFLGPAPLSGNRRVYLVVLNYCLPAGLLHAWSLACFRICADGGCNRLHDELPSMMPPPPEAIATTAAAAEAESKEEQVASSYPAAAAAALNGTSTSSHNHNHCLYTGRTNGHCHDAHGHRSGSGLAEAYGTQPQPPCTPPSSKHQHQQHKQPHQHQQYQHRHQQQHQYRYHASPPPGTLGAAAAVSGGAPAASPQDVAASLRLAHLPDVVLGDLDSLRPDVRSFYVTHGVPFLDMSYDQDTNDLTKAISLVEERYIRTDPEGRTERHQILVLGALGGRLDHTLANLNVLHMFPHLDIALWGDGNLVRLVRPGRALIVPDERFEGPTCGLIPIAGPVTASSTGLRWNLDKTSMRVGGLVSSSNLLTGSPIQVTSDGPLLWSTEMREEPRPKLRDVWASAEAAAAAAQRREEAQQQEDEGKAAMAGVRTTAGAERL